MSEEFQQHGTESGRFDSSKPNLSNRATSRTHPVEHPEGQN